MTDDHAHGVIEIRATHFLFDRDGENIGHGGCKTLVSTKETTWRKAVKINHSGLKPPRNPANSAPPPNERSKSTTYETMGLHKDAPEGPPSDGWGLFCGATNVRDGVASPALPSPKENKTLTFW